VKSKYGFETTEQRSKLMSKIKGKDTIPEKSLRKALWNIGIRYRKTNKGIIGNPDIVIKKYKLTIFVDGEFWHGYKWTYKKQKIKANRDYWIKKIEGNMARDKRVNLDLKKNGWTVLRFWEKEIKDDLDKCVLRIKKSIAKA
jgi:DNA mismatch endonuclease, patch repair protein